MSRRTYTDAEKAEALALYESEGPNEAERRTGIPRGTISSWARRNGVATVATAQTAAAVEAAKLTMAERREALARNLMGDIERLRTELFAPTVEKVVKTVGRGEGYSEPVVVEVKRDMPTFGDKQRLLTTIAIAVDKVLLLTGEATSRSELIGVPDRAVAKERIAKIVHLPVAS